MSSTPKITITYWPMVGRVGPAIMALDYAKIPYERVSASFATWAADSQDLARFPLGDIPVMDVDGRVISESHAISHYAGVLAGLWPKDAFESARAFEVLLTIEEVMTGGWGCNYFKTLMLPHLNPDLTIEKQQELREGPFKSHLLFYARRINEIIAHNGDNGFTVGSSLSVADFAVWMFFIQFVSGATEFVPKTIFNEFSCLAKVFATVEAVEGLKATLDAIKAPKK